MISVADFGTHENLGDDTAAFQAALNAAAQTIPPTGAVYGAEVYIPPGEYTISSTLTVQNGVTLRGAGSRSTRIVYTGTGLCLDLYGCERSTVSDLALLRDGGSGQAIRIYGNVNRIERVYLGTKASTGFGWDKGISIEGDSTLSVLSSTNYIVDTSFWSVKTNSILITRAIDTFLSKVSSFSTPDSVINQHLVIETGASGVYAAQCSFGYGLNGVSVQRTLSTTSPNNSAPVYLFFDQVLADTMSGGHGWNFDSTLGSFTTSAFLTNCWAAAAGLNSSGIATAGANGVLIAGGQGISLRGCRIRSNANNGVIVNSASSSQVSIDGSYVTSNNVANNADGHGVYVTTASADVGVLNCLIGNVLDGNGHQKYGIKIAAAAATGLRIVGNDLGTNSTGPISNASTAAYECLANTPADDTVPGQMYNSLRLSGLGRINDANNAAVSASGGTWNLPHHVNGGIVILRDVTSGGSAAYLVDEVIGVTKIAGPAAFVTGTASANQIGLATAAGGPTTVSNGYGITKNIIALALAAQG